MATSLYASFLKLHASSSSAENSAAGSCRSAYIPPLLSFQYLVRLERIEREREVQESVQVLTAGEAALMVLGCMAAELLAEQGVERMVEQAALDGL